MLCVLCARQDVSPEGNEAFSGEGDIQAQTVCVCVCACVSACVLARTRVTLKSSLCLCDPHRLEPVGHSAPHLASEDFVRGKLKAQGTSFSLFCQAQGFPVPSFR